MLFFMSSTPYCCQIVIKREFSGQIFEIYSNIKFNGNPSSGSPVVPCGRTDRHEEANSRFLQFSHHAYKRSKAADTRSLHTIYYRHHDIPAVREFRQFVICFSFYATLAVHLFVIFWRIVDVLTTGTITVTSYCLHLQCNVGTYIRHYTASRPKKQSLPSELEICCFSVF
jgi:hypothetical protein